MVNVDEFIEDTTAPIHDQISDEHAIIALSDDIDSSVVATLAHEAIGKQLTPVYVDTGLMREGETEQIMNTFSFVENLRVVDARDRLFDALEDVIDPREKRKVIGEQFVCEFEHGVRETDAQYFVQRTICPDRVEFEGNIKSRHSVDGLPDAVDFEGIVEPVRDPYKDEVREVARVLGPESIIAERILFPGPGLATRILDEVAPEKVQVARDACHAVEDGAGKHDPWQAFVAIVGKGTGVKGDNCVRGWIVSMHSVELRDDMTARTQELSWNTLQRAQSCITGTNENVARAVYGVTHKPPMATEYE